jgi:hypothetical protein
VGPDYFRIHPKGVGMVVARPAGLPALTFVEEYLGEVHAPWRWFEIQARSPPAPRPRGALGRGCWRRSGSALRAACAPDSAPLAGSWQVQAGFMEL